ncbi:calpain-5-like [Anneissia japonica]|uniref:calpain-5-like n=2 Tax=Anneissia japonica TaxID=1529436 RepID=UPI00142577D0|nr:calpain-5-like [Anneissia japonica]
MCGLFGTPPTYFDNQNYEEICKSCRASGTLWEDPMFPANNESLFHTKNAPGQIVWKRPKEICEDPKLLVEGADSGDVDQGALGNCWFVAASSSLALHQEIFDKVIPKISEQEWDKDNPERYCGAFRFRFWRFGSWLEVVIDDRLPTVNGELMFIHSQSRNEFWSALLEKAYAKLNGCYENLDGGNTADALTDFTAGVAQSIELSDAKFQASEEEKEELWAELRKAYHRNFLMSCSIKIQSADEMEAKTDEGLVKGHAYGITGVKDVKLSKHGVLSLFNREKVKLVRLRNPWGEKEWNGPWSDGSDEWKKVSESKRKEMGVTIDDDGEFWMPYDKFLIHFTNLVICRMPNKKYLTLHRTWHEKTILSAWKGPTAGGCINNKETFLKNPQFLISIDSDEDDVMLQLTQPDVRADKQQANLTIGFHVMKVEANRKYKVSSIKPKAFTSTFINSRSVFEKRTMKRGRYVMIPSTFAPGEDSPFMVRFFCDGGSQFKELVKSVPSKSSNPLKKYPRAVTSVQVLSASNLEKQDLSGGADPYVYINCEGHKVRSEVKKNSLNPEWEFSAIFYRTNLNKPIIVEIWNHNLVKDTFMGQAIFMAQSSSEAKHHVAPLKDRGRKGQDAKQGNVSVVITTKDDLTEL